MIDIEIPFEKDRSKRYRFFEILPGALSWSVLILPFALSLINPLITIYLIIAYMLLWFIKSIAMNIRAVHGFTITQTHQKLDWTELLKELEQGEVKDPHANRPKWHYDNLLRLQVQPAPVKPNEIIHAIIIATYNESRAVLEPTIQSVLASEYNMKKVILVLAFEERGGEVVEKQAQELINEYKGKFMDAFAVKHPADMPGEVIGKGGNITFAGRKLKTYLEEHKIDPIHVIVTTLDSDNRPHKKYLSALSYTYAATPDPIHVSYQPMPMFTNNIWDAPAPMRVVATGNSFWMTVQSLRPHTLRNFSSHAQGMAALIDTDFWSVRTIVEDGHQFWRTYFRYDGKHEVYPIYLPIYQDAVLSNGYLKTLKAQFIQMRRWAWGASDIAYVAEKGFFTDNEVPKMDLIFKFFRLVEGHLSWATAPLILAGAAFIPLLLNPNNFAANQLPLIASRIQTVALFGIFITLFYSLKTLPPKPARYKRHRSVFMVLQWVLLPVTTITYSACSGLYSQTRLMFGKYLDKFDITEHTVITDDKKTVTGHDIRH
jgi:cellulose synthase/poly-beta-1,6-N-acetylglucosamine synthase-like glycosyltransferase